MSTITNTPDLLQQADGHHDGYQVAKDAVLNLSRALLLGGAA